MVGSLLVRENEKRAMQVDWQLLVESLKKELLLLAHRRMECPAT